MNEYPKEVALFRRRRHEADSFDFGGDGACGGDDSCRLLELDAELGDVDTQQGREPGSGRGFRSRSLQWGYLPTRRPRTVAHGQVRGPETNAFDGEPRRRPSAWMLLGACSGSYNSPSRDEAGHRAAVDRADRAHGATLQNQKLTLTGVTPRSIVFADRDAAPVDAAPVDTVPVDGNSRPIVWPNSAENQESTRSRGRARQRMNMA